MKHSCNAFRATWWRLTAILRRWQSNRSGITIITTAFLPPARVVLLFPVAACISTHVCIQPTCTVETQAAAPGYFAAKVIAGFTWLPARLRTLVCDRLSRAHFHVSDETTDDALRRITTNPRLRSLLTYHWGNYGLPPTKASWAMHCMVANHYFNGGCYPAGGASEIARRIIPTITKAGGVSKSMENECDVCMKECM